MTATVQHLPAGVEQKVPLPPPALQPTGHPVYQVSAEPLLPGQTDTPQTNPIVFLATSDQEQMAPWAS